METANLQEAYEGSYYTITGAGGDLADWTNGINSLFAAQGIGTVATFYQTTGKAVNEFAEARGPVPALNHFQDDLTLLMFPLDGLNGGKLAIFRMMAGDHWFDDLVENMIVLADDEDAEDGDL